MDGMGITFWLEHCVIALSTSLQFSMTYHPYINNYSNINKSSGNIPPRSRNQNLAKQQQQQQQQQQRNGDHPLLLLTNQHKRDESKLFTENKRNPSVTSTQSLATRLRFLKEILPVSSSSKRRKAWWGIRWR